jgi:hypothetical protein
MSSDQDVDAQFERVNVLRLTRAFIAPAAAAAAAAAAAPDEGPPSAEAAGCALWDLTVSDAGAAAVLEHAADAVVELLAVQLARCCAGTGSPAGVDGGAGARAAATDMTAARMAELALGIFANVYSLPEVAGAVAAREARGGDDGEAAATAAADRRRGGAAAPAVALVALDLL